jgi:type II secretory pathway component PulM
VNVAMHQVHGMIARLSPREQRLVALFGSLLAGVLAWSIVVSPFLAGRDRVRTEIEGLKKEIGELQGLAKQIKQTEVDAPKSSAPVKPTADFSVLAFVEKAAGASLRAESIASMTPSKRALDGGRQESLVELKLSSVSLGEVVALLHGIEGEASPVYVKQFSVKKRYDDSSRFDVTLVAAAMLPG